MPTRKAIKKYHAEWLVQIGKFDSIEELYEDDYCFACGFVDRREGDPEDTKYTERAHIWARRDGGPDEVQNIHLLCKWCHKASENMMQSEYIAWFEAQNLGLVMMQSTNVYALAKALKWV